jgi:D-alanine-D-alanine ligase
VVIIFGGRSAEHEISLLSARNILRALDRKRFVPYLIGIDKEGRWFREEGSTILGVDVPEDARLIHLNPNAKPIDPSVLRPDDVVFPVLHGTFGEDGTIQGLLEMHDVAYVGAPVLGSAIGMDKDVTKRLLRDAGIPIVPYRVVTAHTFARDPSLCMNAAADLGYPLFCKPANAGSSVGVSRVRAPADLPGALRAAFQLDRKVLLEKAVDAREIECAVLGNEEPEASAVGEIVLARKDADGFYSYDVKYLDPAAAEFRVPAEIEPAIAERVRTFAVWAFRVLELAGLARVDFFLDRRDGSLYLNEVNTMPGFTAGSGYPKMWAASGVEVRALVTRLLELAIERHAESSGRKLTATPVASPGVELGQKAGPNDPPQGSNQDTAKSS